MSAADTNEVAVRLTRTIEAPPDEVYRAFIDPEQLRRWFGPADFEVVDVDVDALVGGPAPHRDRVP